MPRIRLTSPRGARSLRSNDGFSLIEAVAAIAVLGVFISGAAAALAYGTQAAGDNGLRARAVQLASGGLEAVRGIRDNDFSDLAAGTYALSNAGGEWQLGGGTETVGPFTRAITIIETETDVRSVTANVSWGGRNVAATTQFTDWQAASSGGGGGGQPDDDASCDSYAQSQGYASGICRQNAGRCSSNGETYLPDGDSYCTGGASADTCCAQ